MTFTEADLENLKAALISGARKVQIGDRIVEYRSQNEILAAIRLIEQTIAGTSTDSETANVITSSFSRGEE
jgi:hypothetical protein